MTVGIAHRLNANRNPASPSQPRRPGCGGACGIINTAQTGAETAASITRGENPQRTASHLAEQIRKRRAGKYINTCLIYTQWEIYQPWKRTPRGWTQKTNVSDISLALNDKYCEVSLTWGTF